MRVALLVVLSVMTSPVVAQVTMSSVDVQQPAWVSSPDSSTLTVHVNTPDGQSGPILHKAFSAKEVRHSQQILPDGTHVDHADESRFFRDGQGRMRDEGTRYAIIFDPVADATYSLHLKDRMYNQYAGAGKNTTTISTYGGDTHISSPGQTGPVQNVKWGNVPYHSDPVSHVDTEQLGQQTINGIACKGTRVTITIPAHTVGNDREIRVVNERWYSDELAVLVKSSNDDPRFGTTTYELRDVSRGEPDPALFKVPEGFTKVARSY